MHPRQLFPRLNLNFNIKHITLDLKKSGISDKVVYDEAVKLQRIIVTFNGDDFKPLAALSNKSGVIALSVNLSDDQIDKKLTAFLIKSKQNDIFGKFVTITGET